MNLSPLHPHDSRQPDTVGEFQPLSHLRRTSAFTMVEIALSIAVVAFALVAILGVLPTGLQVQKDNREDTIINQDGTFLLEAIKGGSEGTYDLAYYVDSITVSNRGPSGVQVLTRSNSFPDRIEMDGRHIVGLLSTPKYGTNQSGNWPRLGYWNTNIVRAVTARMRAISGSLIEKPPFGSKEVAFSYLLTSEVTPVFAAPRFQKPAGTNLVALEEWQRLMELQHNAYDVRLTFRWPLLPNGRTGTGRRTFRTVLSGEFAVTNLAPTSNPFKLYFFDTSGFKGLPKQGS